MRKSIFPALLGAVVLGGGAYYLTKGDPEKDKTKKIVAGGICDGPKDELWGYNDKLECVLYWDGFTGAGVMAITLANWEDYFSYVEIDPTTNEPVLDLMGVPKIKFYDCKMDVPDVVMGRVKGGLPKVVAVLTAWCLEDMFPNWPSETWAERYPRTPVQKEVLKRVKKTIETLC